MNHKSNINRKVKAKICWIPAAAGGREFPPVGPRYSTVAKFAHEAHKWPHEAWSIVADFTKESDDPSYVIAEVSLLVTDAPADLLELGSKFELYEGRQLVGRGEVIKAGVESSSPQIYTRANVAISEA